MTSRLRPTCERCSCVLAWDNPGPLCGPCGRSAHERTVLQSAIPLAHRGVDRAAARRAWEAGRLPGLAAMLDASLHDALEVANGLDLLPAHLARQLTSCHRLLECDAAGPQEAGRVVGVSRWTVTAWRRELGLTRSARGSARSA